jgi:membrane-bound serine protease (ClpP class)
MSKKNYILGSIWLALTLLVTLVGGAAAQSGGALALTIDGPLTAVHALYLERGLGRAERDGAELVILRLNTPGGQIDIMDQLVAQIRASAVPVVVYVSPRNATAGSAGTIITLAGHAAAMAPETVIGAASPVGGQGEDLDSTLQSKLKEDMKAHVRALAAHRPPEAIVLAEATIEEARAATAAEAFAVGMVDFLAADLPDLLHQLDGFTVTVGDGEARPLRTTGLSVAELPMSFIEQLLNLLTNPNVVFLLLSLGPLLILNELSSPGGWLAGFLGVVCLLLAFYGLGVLPVNWFGLIFVALAFVLFVMEVNAPTHGGLAAAGIGSLIVGALVLFNSPGTPSFFRVSVPLVVGTSLVLAAAVIALMTFALRAQRRPIVVGVEALAGQEGEVRTPDSVHVAGELWSAVPIEGEAGTLVPGQKVLVEKVKGLKVVVKQKGK